ncbi:MAG: oligosaccharide flippase family protein [Bdellovibrionales bacterium]|nr:oligosaccharide flippase family protein [Bdellovibrionales bacterium]
MLIFGFTELLSKISIAGLNGGVLHKVGDLEQLNRERETLFWIHGSALFGIILSILLASLVSILSEDIVMLVFSNAKLSEFLSLYAWLLPPMTLSRIYMGALRHKMNLKHEVLSGSVLEPGVTFFVGIALVQFLGLEGVFIAHFFAYCISAGYLIYFNQKSYLKVSFPSSISIDECRKLLSDSLYFFGIGSLNLLKHHLDVFVIGRLLTLKDVAVYSACLEISVLIKKVRLILEPILMPVVKSIKDDKNELKKQIRNVLVYSSYFSLLAIGFFCFQGDFILNLFGDGYSENHHILLILLMGQYCFTVFGVLETTMYMFGEPRAAFEQNILLVFLSLTFLFVLVPRFGMIGAAIASSTASFLVGSVNVWRSYKLKNFFPFGKKFFHHVGFFIFLVAMFFAIDSYISSYRFFWDWIIVFLFSSMYLLPLLFRKKFQFFM